MVRSDEGSSLLEYALLLSLLVLGCVAALRHFGFSVHRFYHRLGHASSQVRHER